VMDTRRKFDIVFLAGFLAVSCTTLCEGRESCIADDLDPGSTGTFFLQAESRARLAAQKPYYWAGKNGDDLRSGASNHVLDLEMLKKGPAWSFIDGPHGVVRAAPLIDDKMNIYLSTVQNKMLDSVGTVRKFNSDGKILWNYTDTSNIPEVPILYEGAIYFTNSQGLVTALDMETGKQIWRKSALVKNATGSATDTWSMAAGRGTLISAVSSNGKFNDYVVALNAATGEVKWSFRPDVMVYNSLVGVNDGAIVFSDNFGKLYKLDLSTGELIWKVGPAKRGETVQSVQSTGGTILGQNGIAYVTSNVQAGSGTAGLITAFNFSDGNLLWRESTQYEANNGAVIGKIGGRLAVAIGVGSNPDMPDPIKQRIMQVADNDPSLPEKKARVIALDAATGELIWSYELPAWHGWGAGETLREVCLPDSFGNAAIDGSGNVFVGFQSGQLLGINDKDGNGQISPDEIAEFNTGRCVQGTPAIAPGMLAFTPCHGLYVFKS